MSETHPVVQLTRNAEASLPSFEPSAFLRSCQSHLKFDFGEDGAFDPFDGKGNSAHKAYREAVQFLSKHNFQWAAERLLFDAWNYLGDLQRTQKRRAYRALFSCELARLYIRAEDKGAALRWALLTHADDMLEKHPYGGGVGKEWLLTTLGMREDEVARLDSIAAENVKEVEEDHSNDWSQSAGFAEDVIVKLLQRGYELAHLFSFDTNINEFPLCPSYFRALWDRVSKQDQTSVKKGNSLEELASYIFTLVPGWVPRRNALQDDSSYETDLIVSNLSRRGNLTSELLGRHFLVECKNWNNSVGAKEVGYFLYRMRLTHAKFGVILTSSKITGEDEKDARALIRRAFHEDGNICIVLNNDDLKNLLDGKSSFWGILLEKIERLRFGKPRDQKKDGAAAKSKKQSKDTPNALPD